MHTIKKYANRKLYHTNRKQYITLEGIARLVQQGEPVQVLDNETGEDITASILSQIVLNARGRSGGPLPATVLTGLIQIGGDTLAGVRRALFSSLGGLDLIETEIDRRLDYLAEEGTLSPADAERLRTLLLRRDLAASAPTENGVVEVDVPSRYDVAHLHAQVDALAAAVEQLLRERQPPGSGSARKDP